jgi:hypothetical protein
VQNIPDNSAQYANENSMQLAKVIALHILQSSMWIMFYLPTNVLHTLCLQQSQGRTACSWLHFDGPIFIGSGGTGVASSADQRW